MSFFGQKKFVFLKKLCYFKNRGWLGFDAGQEPFRSI